MWSLGYDREYKPSFQGDFARVDRIKTRLQAMLVNALLLSLRGEVIVDRLRLRSRCLMRTPQRYPAAHRSHARVPHRELVRAHRRGRLHPELHRFRVRDSRDAAGAGIRPGEVPASSRCSSACVRSCDPKCMSRLLAVRMALSLLLLLRLRHRTAAAGDRGASGPSRSHARPRRHIRGQRLRRGRSLRQVPHRRGRHDQLSARGANPGRG